MKRSSKKGFTLAELLIVIAIIAVLVAIMIPVFSSQLDKARAAAELANVRAAYAEALANAMVGEGDLDANDTVTIKAEDIKAALKYPEKTIVTLTVAPDGTNDGTIKVEYGNISGTFDIDEDVTITKGGTALNVNETITD